MSTSSHTQSCTSCYLSKNTAPWRWMRLPTANTVGLHTTAGLAISQKFFSKLMSRCPMPPRLRFMTVCSRLTTKSSVPVPQPLAWQQHLCQPPKRYSFTWPSHTLGLFQERVEDTRGILTGMRTASCLKPTRVRVATSGKNTTTITS